MSAPTVSDALLALGLGAIALLISFWQGLNLEISLVLTLGRAVLQLVVLAYLLAFVLSVQVAWGLGLGLVLLWAVSTKLLTTRLGQSGVGVALWAGLALGASLLPVAYGVLVVIRPEDWFAPQVWLPLASVVLANGVVAGSAAGEQFGQALQRERRAIETHLSLGATPAQAVQAYRRSALRLGVLPTLQTGAVAGLGSLPVFMGGQIFAGLDPLVAVVYELLLLLLVICSGLVSVSILILGLQRLAFTPLAQLREN